MTKWYCDRCGGELEIRLDRGYHFSFGKRGFSHQQAFDLCEPCGASISHELAQTFAAEIERRAEYVRAYRAAWPEAYGGAEAPTAAPRIVRRKAARKSRRV